MGGDFSNGSQDSGYPFGKRFSGVFVKSMQNQRLTEDMKLDLSYWQFLWAI